MKTQVQPKVIRHACNTHQLSPSAPSRQACSEHTNANQRCIVHTVALILMTANGLWAEVLLVPMSAQPLVWGNLQPAASGGPLYHR